MKHLIALAALAWTMATGCHAQQRQKDTFTTPSGKTVTFTCIKHASIMIEYDGKVFHIDPVADLEPKTDYAQLPKANFILVTHEHRDHFDREAITLARSTATNIYVNDRVYNEWHSGVVLRNGDSISIAPDIQIVAVPAYNTTPDREQFHPKGRDNGYVLILDGFRIYIAGDTEDIPEMASLTNIDVAFLPCNQPYTMTPQQLVKAAKSFRPKVLFPYHYSKTPINQVQLLMAGSGIEVRIRKYQ